MSYFINRRLFKTIVVCIFVTLCSTYPALANSFKEVTVSIFGTSVGNLYLNEAFFINDEDAPVKISNVQAMHVPSEVSTTISSLSRSQKLKSTTVKSLEENSWAFSPKGVVFDSVSLDREKLFVKISAEGQKVTAVKFTIVAIDAFNEVLGGLTGVSMEAPTKDMKWSYTPAYLFKFKKYGVVGVYLQQARLEDGSIWNHDSKKISREFLSKYRGLDKNKLEKALGGDE